MQSENCKMKSGKGIFKFAICNLQFAISMCLLAILLFSGNVIAGQPRGDWGTASLMVIVEREAGSVIIIESSRHKFLGRVSGLGNLIHATVKFSKDARFAYVIGRDAFVSKIDLLKLKVVKKVKAGEDSVGGVMTQDSRYIALSNYVPGEVRVLDADTLETVKVIAVEKELPGGKMASRVVGLVDAPGNLLIFSLMDGDGLWVVDAGEIGFPVIKKFWDVGAMPYDALITPDGRYYLVGLLNSGWVGLLDTWDMSEVKKVTTVKIREIAGAEEGETVPLWKIPHLKGWAIAGDLAVLPAIKRKVALVYSTRDWSLVREVPLAGTALYTVAGPDGRYVWVDLVGENGDVIQVIDLKTLDVIKTITPGRGATHPQFTPKGDAVYISLMDEDKVVVYNPVTFEKIKEFSAKRPSGIFSTERAHKFGM